MSLITALAGQKCRDATDMALCRHAGSGFLPHAHRGRRQLQAAAVWAACQALQEAAAVCLLGLSSAILATHQYLCAGKQGALIGSQSKPQSAGIVLQHVCSEYMPANTSGLQQ